MYWVAPQYAANLSGHFTGDLYPLEYFHQLTGVRAASSCGLNLRENRAPQSHFFKRCELVRQSVGPRIDLAHTVRFCHVVSRHTSPLRAQAKTRGRVTWELACLPTSSLLCIVSVMGLDLLFCMG